MELYILDSLLRRTQVIDQFESLIWTDRYSASGDFELVVSSSIAFRQLFLKGTRVTVSNSYRFGIIDTVEDAVNDDGQAVLTIKGSSVENVLDNRSILIPTGNGVPTWTMTDLPAVIARALFAAICINNTAQPGDNIPYYTPGSLYSPDTIAEPSQSVTFTATSDSLYTNLKTLCDNYGLGFRLYRGLDDQTVYFNVYTGTDRTSNQTAVPAVIFSPALDTISDVSELDSIAAYKNVAYVVSDNDYHIVYRAGEETVTGFDRRVLYVDVSSETTLPQGDQLTAYLIQRGNEELAKNAATFAIDGQVSQTVTLDQGFVYDVGDLVEMRSEHGTKQSMRVTEVIHVSDDQGDRVYPTLVVETVITPGSWYALDYEMVWDTAPGVWDDYE